MRQSQIEKQIYQTYTQINYAITRVQSILQRKLKEYAAENMPKRDGETLRLKQFKKDYAEYERKITAECDRICDKLMFGDATEALTLIEAFEKF